MSQRFRTQLAPFTSFVAGFLTLFVVTLALAPRAEGFVYWTNGFGGIGRANLDGTGVDKRFIHSAGDSFGVAVDAEHVYWSNRSSPASIGRADLDGAAVDQSFITAASGPGAMAVDAGPVAVDGAHIYWSSSFSPPRSDGPTWTARTWTRASSP